MKTFSQPKEAPGRAAEQNAPAGGVMQAVGAGRPQLAAQQHWQQALTDSPRQVAQRQQAAGRTPPNRTGLPDDLKAGVESMSGLSLDDVQVHYNSSQPAQLQALAYAQGSDIHLGPGQEEHLPHEAWHVVQQKQGRVRPTMQLKAGTPVNDDDKLEREADAVAQRLAAPAATTAADLGSRPTTSGPTNGRVAQRKVRVHLDSDYNSVKLDQVIIDAEVITTPTVNGATKAKMLERQGNKREVTATSDLDSTTHNTIAKNKGLAVRHVIPEQSYRDELIHQLRGNSMGDARTWLNGQLQAGSNLPNVRLDVQQKADEWLSRKINDPRGAFIGNAKENQQRGQDYDNPLTADGGNAFDEEERLRLALYRGLGKNPKALGAEPTAALKAGYNADPDEPTWQQDEASGNLAYLYTQSQKAYYKTPEEKNARDAQWAHNLGFDVVAQNVQLLNIYRNKVQTTVWNILQQVADQQRHPTTSPQFGDLYQSFYSVLSETVLQPMTSMLESQSRRGENRATRAQKADMYFQAVIKMALSSNQEAVMEHAGREFVSQQQQLEAPRAQGSQQLVPRQSATQPLTFGSPVQSTGHQLVMHPSPFTGGSQPVGLGSTYLPPSNSNSTFNFAPQPFHTQGTFTVPHQPDTSRQSLVPYQSGRNPGNGFATHSPFAMQTGSQPLSSSALVQTPSQQLVSSGQPFRTPYPSFLTSSGQLPSLQQLGFHQGLTPNTTSFTASSASFSSPGGGSSSQLPPLLLPSTDGQQLPHPGYNLPLGTMYHFGSNQDDMRQ